MSRAAVVLVLALLGGACSNDTAEVTTTTAAATTTTASTATTATTEPGIGVPFSIVSFAPLLAVSAQEAWTVSHGNATDPVFLVWHLADGAWVSDPLPGEDVWPQRLAVAPDGTVWVAAQNGVFSFDGARWTRRFNTGDDVAVDEAGNVWIGGQLGDHQLWLARLDGQRWTRVGPNSQAPSGSFGATTLAVASDGGVWIGGWFEEQLCFFKACPSGTELMRYDGATLEAVPIENSRLPGIMALETAPDGTLWVFADPGLHSYDGAEWAFVDVECPLADQSVMEMPDANDLAVGPDGTVWFNCARGLVSFDGTEWTTWVEGQWVYAVDVAPDGTVWYSSETGLHTLTP